MLDDPQGGIGNVLGRVRDGLAVIAAETAGGRHLHRPRQIAPECRQQREGLPVPQAMRRAEPLPQLAPDLRQEVLEPWW